jgi:hypothetical protein
VRPGIEVRGMGVGGWGWGLGWGVAGAGARDKVADQLKEL